jgi:hypothetical protein
MAAGEGTGMAGRPPLTGKETLANSIILSTRIIYSFLVRKH